MRQTRQFPPFADMIVLTVSGTEEVPVLRGSVRLREGLLAWQNSPVMADHPFRVLGPAPAPVVKVNGRYRYHLTICGKNDRAIRGMVVQLMRAAAEDKQNRGLAVSADLNPID